MAYLSLITYPEEGQSDLEDLRTTSCMSGGDELGLARKRRSVLIRAIYVDGLPMEKDKQAYYAEQWIQWKRTVPESCMRANEFRKIEAV